MKKRIIVAVCFLLVLFLASPLFGGLVGAIPLSEKEVENLREEYPYIYMQNGFADYEIPWTHCFSRNAQKADTIVYCEVIEITRVPIYATPAYIVRIYDDSHNLFRPGELVELRKGVDWLKRELVPGDRLAVPVHRFFENDKAYGLVHSGEMFYVTGSGHVLSFFDESDRWINYDRKIHSGMTVQALLRKYIPWDGVPSARDFKTPNEADNWLKQWGYYPYDE